MKLFRVLSLFLTFLAGISLNAQTETHYLFPVEFKVLAEKTKGIIIDVRDKDEYEFAHIQDAIQIGVESEDFIIKIKELNKNKSYFVYCSMGKRSDEAIRIMQSEGFKNVFGLKGGFLAWKKEELPIVKHSKN